MIQTDKGQATRRTSKYKRKFYHFTLYCFLVLYNVTGPEIHDIDVKHSSIKHLQMLAKAGYSNLCCSTVFVRRVKFLHAL